MAEKKIRAGIDFDAMNPPAIITNPLEDGAVLNSDFPRHVHKYAPPQKGDHYTSGEYKIVNSEAELVAALKDGWNKEPVLTEPDEYVADAGEQTNAPEPVKKTRKPRAKKDAA